MTLLSANRKELAVGSTVVARDTAGNLIVGNVSSVHQDGKHIRVNTTPILVRADHAMAIDDAAAPLDKAIADAQAAAKSAAEAAQDQG